MKNLFYLIMISFAFASFSCVVAVPRTYNANDYPSASANYPQQQNYPPQQQNYPPQQQQNYPPQNDNYPPQNYGQDNGGYAAANNGAYQQNVNFQIFYDNLSSYGHWINNPQYGYVWIPEVAPGFMPYATAGHWVYTEYGWTWASEYPWGWAPFHYGRWQFDDFVGWYWIPDDVWGPAWVAWRRSPGYYGWAPLGPGITVAFYEQGRWECPAYRWTFLEDRYINSDRPYGYYRPRGDNDRYIHSSEYIRNSYEDRERHQRYISGPDVQEVRQVTHGDVRVMPFKESHHPGEQLNNNEINLYRPSFGRVDAAHPAPAPAKVEQRENIRRVPPQNEPNRQGEPQRPAERPQQPIERPQQPMERPQQPMERPQQPMERPQQPMERPQEPAQRPQAPREQPQVPAQREQAPAQQARPQQYQRNQAPAQQRTAPKQQQNRPQQNRPQQSRPAPRQEPQQNERK